MIPSTSIAFGESLAVSVSAFMGEVESDLQPMPITNVKASKSIKLFMDVNFGRKIKLFLNYGNM